MYQAIVFLPLLGAIIAALIALAGAHARHPGGPPATGGEDHARGSVRERTPPAAAAPARGARPPTGGEDHARGSVDESRPRAAPSPHQAHAVIGASHGEPAAA